MDLRSWIAQQHFTAHFLLDSDIISKLNDALMRARPEAGGNSVAWLIWHVARCEDLAVNSIVRGEPQVLTSGDWRERLGGSGMIGTGMSDDEVGTLTSSVNLQALLAYRKAVRDRTATWIGTVDPAVLDVTPDLDDRLGAADRLWPEAGAWVRDMWKPWPASVFLNWVAIGHTLMHIGEMRTNMALLGVEMR